MRHILVLNQKALMSLEPLSRPSIEAALLLSYFKGWFTTTKSRKKPDKGGDYTWIQCQTAIKDTPVIFHQDTSLRSNKNRMTILVKELRRANLIETKRTPHQLWLRPTPLGLSFLGPSITVPDDDSVIDTGDAAVTVSSDAIQEKRKKRNQEQEGGKFIHFSKDRNLGNAKLSRRSDWLKNYVKEAQ